MYKSLRYFQVYRPLVSLPVPLALGHQVECSPDYASQGTDRQAAQHCIFHYTLRGRGTIMFHGQEIGITPGTGFLCIINDPDMSYYYPPDGQDEWEFIWFGYGEGHSRALTRELQDRYGPVFQLSPDDGLVRRWLRLGQTGDVPISVDGYEGARWVDDLLFTLGQSAAQRDRQHGFPLGERLIRLLEEHKGNCNVNGLAGQLGVSREYLSRSFRKHTGETLSVHLQKYKCTRACQLLSRTDRKIGDVAAQLGFANASNFGRLFKAQVGMTPEEFRATHAAHGVPLVWSRTSD